MKFELTDIGNNVNIHSELQTAYLTNVADNGDFDCMPEYAQGTEEKSRPVPVKLSWVVTGDVSVESYCVRISKYEDMSKPFYSASTAQNSLDIYNLEIGTTYYWTVSVNVTGEEITSDPASFTTSGVGPRNLYIDGVTNVRDLGGWQTVDGGRIKQGMIYRGGRMDISEDGVPVIKITESGKRWLKEILGVRSDIDLRTLEETENLNESPLGSDVTFARYSMITVHDIITDNTEMTKKVFAFLANQEHYPVFIHCGIGVDRTGMICFLISALCGASEEALCTDFMFSNFGYIYGSRNVGRILREHIPMVSQAEGDSLGEKTYNYLLQSGVPKEHLDAVIALLSEK